MVIKNEIANRSCIKLTNNLFDTEGAAVAFQIQNGKYLAQAPYNLEY